MGTKMRVPLITGVPVNPAAGMVSSGSLFQRSVPVCASNERMDLSRVPRNVAQPLGASDPAVAEILSFIGGGKHRTLCLPADDGNKS